MSFRNENYLRIDFLAKYQWYSLITKEVPNVMKRLGGAAIMLLKSACSDAHLMGRRT